MGILPKSYEIQKENIILKTKVEKLKNGLTCFIKFT